MLVAVRCIAFSYAFLQSARNSVPPINGQLKSVPKHGHRVASAARAWWRRCGRSLGQSADWTPRRLQPATALHCWAPHAGPRQGCLPCAPLPGPPPPPPPSARCASLTVTHKCSQQWEAVWMPQAKLRPGCSPAAPVPGRLPTTAALPEVLNWGLPSNS